MIHGTPPSYPQQPLRSTDERKGGWVGESPGDDVTLRSFNVFQSFFAMQSFSCFFFRCSSITRLQMKTTKKGFLSATGLPSLKWILRMALSIVLILVFQCQSCVVSAKCSHHQVNVCTEDFKLCHCISCKNCSAGYGLVPQCGSQVIMQFPQCFKCKQGKAYSQEFSMESCQPCPICYGTKTLKACSRTQPTKCSEECQDGYEFNPTTEMCEQVINVPTKSPSIAIRELHDITQHYTTQLQTITTLKPTRNTATKTVNSWTTITLSATGGLLFSAAAVFIIYKKRRFISRRVCCRESADAIREEEIPLTTTFPENTSLNSISPNLRDKIAVKISKKARGIRGWQDIGYEYEIHKDDLDAMDYYSESSNPGDLLLQKLHTLKPQETLRQFMVVLHKLKRKDVIEIINNEYSHN